MGGQVLGSECQPGTGWSRVLGSVPWCHLWAAEGLGFSPAINFFFFFCLFPLSRSSFSGAYKFPPQSPIENFEPFLLSLYN